MVVLSDYEALLRAGRLNERPVREREMERPLGDTRRGGRARIKRLSAVIHRVRVRTGRRGRIAYELVMDSVCCVIAPLATRSGCCSQAPSTRAK
jgi:hypothetical protein